MTPVRTLPHRRAGAGPVLVLVHGYLGGSEQWMAEIDRFSDRFDVIAPDLPGFGDAADWAPCGTIGELAAAVTGLLDDLGIGLFTLLGHSMGGMVAQEAAAARPDRVERLVLYGTGPLGLMPDRFEPIDVSRERLKHDGVARTIRRIGATWFSCGREPKGLDLLVRIGSHASEAAALAGLDAMQRWDGRGALGRLTMPSLVLWGDGDRSYRWPQVEALWRGLPDARLAVIPGVSHAAHMEKPGLFHAILADFLRQKA